MFLYQREPHARQLAFTDVAQPANYAERLALAVRTCEELALDQDLVWVDRMDDRTRAMLGDLPSSAVVVDPFGVIRHKLPWAEPERIEPLLTALVPVVDSNCDSLLRTAADAKALGAPTLPVIGAALWRSRRGGSSEAQQVSETTERIAATGLASSDWQMPAESSWLTWAACAALLESPKTPTARRHAAWRMLQEAEDEVVRAWAKGLAKPRSGS